MLISNLYSIQNINSIISINIPLNFIKEIKEYLMEYQNTLDIKINNFKKGNFLEQIDIYRKEIMELIFCIERSIIYNHSFIELTFYEYVILYEILNKKQKKFNQYFNKDITSVKKIVFEKFYFLENSIVEYLWDPLDDDIPNFICLIVNENEITYLLDYVDFIYKDINEDKLLFKTNNFKEQIIDIHEYDSFLLKFKKILETGTTLININIKELYFLKLFYSEVYYYYLNIKIPFLNIYNNSNEEEENFIIESKNEFDKIPLNSNDNITECFVI